MEEDEDAMTLWHQLVLNSVECELCNEPYSSSGPHIPRLLSCGHTFCESCLNKWSLTTSGTESHQHGEQRTPERSVGVFASFTSAINASLNSSASSADSNHSSSIYASYGNNTGVLWIECPTCRTMTQLPSEINPIRNLPKNYELLRVRDEMQSSQIHHQLSSLKEKWLTHVVQKEHLARDAKEVARLALHESEEAASKSRGLAKQVEINEQEKLRAQQLAKEAKEKAIRASHKAEMLQEETEQLKQQLRSEASELRRLQSDATTTAAATAELHTRAQQLQRQIDRVSAQLSLHSGRHDPAKLVVLVCEPMTVGKWLLPYTRYAVISITTETGTVNKNGEHRSGIDQDKKNSFKAAKMWIMQHQVAEPSASVKVYRRYSDFVWLHQQLCRKHPFELVPGIPGKQVFFNKENEFVGERMKLLQAFLRNVLRHPVLALVEEVRSFLLSTTEELDAIRLRSVSTARAIDELEFGLWAANLNDSALVDSELNERRLQRCSDDHVPTTISKQSESSRNTWAWGAISAITNSAAKMMRTTADSSSAEESKEVKLSKRYESNCSDLEDGAIESRADKFVNIANSRHNYTRVCSAYENTALKGSFLARAERKQAKHLHRVCELLNDMDLLERSFDRLERQRHAEAHSENLPSSMRESIGAQRQQQVFFETRTFDARAADSFSAFSLLVKSTADCNEYALLEIVRMQLLQLGAIEESYSRLRQLENSIQDKLSAAAKSSGEENHLSGSACAEMDWNLQAKKLKQCREEVGEKVSNLDPTRSLFVLETLQENVTEMHILSKERRHLYEETLRQITVRGM
uniref:Uncharacterized protein AlNc14C109G6333 n=1 Tax=Albugo laibachii Nc14 TaxID=890382 RepID=F0WID2_9STRA|nr:conserved hypothetical protein [Albugo laibachii Nc14]|eukprot:CCA21013.1 conserved hypothetical protein [Albugo laibachii Nc14]